MPEFIEILDTTLRDGEQMAGVSFNAEEKLAIAKFLLLEARLDRIEIASARLSEKEKETAKKIAEWAQKNGLLEKISVLGFVDIEKSVNWAIEAGIKNINLLCKGSEKHCIEQLRKKPEEHFEEIRKTIENAKNRGMKIDCYLEAWSTGMNENREYVFEITKKLLESGAGRIMLGDTLGILTPETAKKFLGEMKKEFPSAIFEFHGHNDYGLATANSLAAAEAGAKGVHATVNGIGERAGNTALEEIIVAINDNTGFKTRVVEEKLFKLSKMVESFSGKRISENKPVAGANVFTQTAGVHADGDKKANLYTSKLNAERFGRKKEYALGKLSGKASLELNLKKLGMELTEEQKKIVLERIVALGDKKEKITAEDLPFIVADVLDTPEQKKIEILNCKIFSGKNIVPEAEIEVKSNGFKFYSKASGDGGYDAFMNALGIVAKKMKLELAELADYEVRIPPGGKTDALVETTISWKKGSNSFITIGVDSDQTMAAIKATEKMLNILTMGKK